MASTQYYPREQTCYQFRLEESYRYNTNLKARNHVEKLKIRGNALLDQPAGKSSWFVAGLLPLRLRVRPWSMSVDFHDAENRQRPCRMIMRHVKNPLSVRLW
ncbi:hypothetical protein TNCV_4507331 [Trichonephila clavipes]|nr:hypothetical protein TNCV_4507331 [Trichonephila clavipes]